MAFSLTNSYADQYRYILENYDICDYERIEIKETSQGYSLLIRLPEPNELYLIDAIIGTSIGPNHGMIMEINQSGFSVEEIISDCKGGWRSRKTVFHIERDKIRDCPIYDDLCNKTGQP